MTNVYATELISAKDVQKVTKEATKTLEDNLIKSKKGKKAYSGIINFLNKKISTIATGGFYNMYNMTYRGKYPTISTLLSPLNNKEQDIMRSLIVKELIKKGYTVTYNEFWDNPNNLFIGISWKK